MHKKINQSKERTARERRRRDEDRHEWRRKEKELCRSLSGIASSFERGKELLDKDMAEMELCVKEFK